MFTLNRTESFTQEIKKSRFTAIATTIANEANAKLIINDTSDLTANHNCWAWRIGQNYRFSDDGEPSGTAGKSILQAIDGQELDNVLVIVTRWFGGVLLGSGGLMRAYGGTASTCLRQAEKTLIIPSITVEFECGFSDLAIVKSRLTPIDDLTLDNETFTGTGALIQATIPLTSIAMTATMIKNLTSGRVIIPIPE